MIRNTTSMALAALLALGTPSLSAEVRQVISSLSHPDHPLLPRDARKSQCFVHEVTPAIIETTTHKTQLTPPRLAVDLETGETEVVRKATYRTQTSQRVVRARQERLFETVCPQHYTERFVQSLQRALRARGFGDLRTSGWIDPETEAAIRAYQQRGGLDSAMLSLKTAEDFGLVSHSDFQGLTGN